MRGVRGEAELEIELGQRVFYGGGYQEIVAVLLFEHALGDGVIEEGEQGIVEAIDVEQQDGFRVEPEGLPGEDFEHLLEGSEAAGEDEEGVGLLAHESLAGVHGVDDVELRDAAMGYLEINEDDGYHSGYISPRSDGGVRDGLHKADVRASVDEAYVASGESGAQLRGGVTIDWVDAVGRGTKDSEVASGSSGGR